MTYSTAFMRAVQDVLKEEGGYVNDPRDPGGETQYGISKRAYPNVDIARLTIEDAIAIYHRDYWLAASCEKLPARLAGAVFDAAVNQGVSRAIQMLQHATGVMVDGKVGPVTIAAASKPGALVDFTVQRILHYAALPAFKTYGKGWLRRTVRSALTANEA